MAFTAEQKISICKILGVNGMDLDVRLSYYATYITAAVETAVIAEIARWTAGAGTDFVAVEPKEKNFGARIDPELEKTDIRKNLGLMLYCSDLIGSSNGGGSLDSFEVERG